MATLIQKNWRGFHTRQLLREYFDQLFLESQHLIQQNYLGLNKSQQYLYQQQQNNLIILEDEREDYSETLTHLSKIKKVFLGAFLYFQRNPDRANIGSSPFMMKKLTMIIRRNRGNSLYKNKLITRKRSSPNLQNSSVENPLLCMKKFLYIMSFN
jgi:hypothetical protein